MKSKPEFCVCARAPLAIVAVLLVASISYATAIPLAPATPLSDLLQAGASLKSGDKLFEDFDYHETGDMPKPEDVNIIPIQDLAGNFGIRVQGAFADLPGGGGSDSLLTYKVTADGPGLLISDAILRANLAVFGGAGIASVTESFANVPNEQLTIFHNGNTLQQVDSHVFAQPVKSLFVEKNILLLAGTPDPGVSNGSGATVSFIDQTFSQIPEPSGLFMLVVGSICLVRCLRRR